MLPSFETFASCITVTHFQDFFAFVTRKPAILLEPVSLTLSIFFQVFDLPYTDDSRSRDTPVEVILPQTSLLQKFMLDLDFLVSGSRVLFVSPRITTSANYVLPVLPRSLRNLKHKWLPAIAKRSFTPTAHSLE